MDYNRLIQCIYPEGGCDFGAETAGGQSPHPSDAGEPAGGSSPCLHPLRPRRLRTAHPFRSAVRGNGLSGTGSKLPPHATEPTMAMIADISTNTFQNENLIAVSVFSIPARGIKCVFSQVG